MADVERMADRGHQYRQYLNSKGAANTASGDGTLTRTKPSVAGSRTDTNTIPARRFKRWRTVSAGCGAGARDQRPVLSRADVLVYHSSAHQRHRGHGTDRRDAVRRVVGVRH